MLDVFVETNWVVECVAPAHHRGAAAVALRERASRGELRLHLPAICLVEARKVVQTSTRFARRREADAVRHFVARGLALGEVTGADAGTVRRIVDQMEAHLEAEFGALSDRLRAIRDDSAIDVFGLDDEMLARSTALATEVSLESFDLAILGAVLVRAERLRGASASGAAFCEIDRDLLPWDNKGRAKEPLRALYDAARVWVFEDFDLAAPAPPEGWFG